MIPFNVTTLIPFSLLIVRKGPNSTTKGFLKVWVRLYNKGMGNFTLMVGTRSIIEYGSGSCVNQKLELKTLEACKLGLEMRSPEGCNLGKRYIYKCT